MLGQGLARLKADTSAALRWVRASTLVSVVMHKMHAMNHALATVLLLVLIKPAAFVSWMCIRYLGAFSRAYDEAQAHLVFKAPGEIESTGQPSLPQNLRLVIEAARSDT